MTETFQDPLQDSSPTPSAQQPIAFFCAEFGVRSDLPLYAGGLGVLAGDILKQAAADHTHMVGVGLLYRGEGAIQRITPEGQQIEEHAFFDPVSVGLEHVYLDGMPLFIKVHLTEIDVWVRVWQMKLGETVTLYLLDTETDQNHISQRGIASALYAGTEEELVKQQLILGIGGVKLLQQLGLRPALYHVNEGRPAFLHWQLIRQHMDTHGTTYTQAAEAAREKTVYTNHTLVDAGNQAYTTDLLKIYGRYYAEKMGISVERLLEPGIEQAADNHTTVFRMTRYALNTSRKATAVSQLHGEFCKKRWPEYDWMAVTNGVYLPYWQDQRLKTQLTDEELWSVHLDHKRQLAAYVQQRTGYGYDPQRLVVTWARRMAGYKQSEALFTDIDRLARLLHDMNRPVQLLIAGKAHMVDVSAKQSIERMISHMKGKLAGGALFVPNLDMELDQMLTRGSDVWLNTPEFGKEACGTSGMKALSNGVLQCTVADGWAAEVDWEGVGWVVDHQRMPESLYTLLEEKIIPMFYQREAGVSGGESVRTFSVDWLAMMQRSIALSHQFSAARMMKEYLRSYKSAI